jgi:hypothetical protein
MRMKDLEDVDSPYCSTDRYYRENGDDDSLTDEEYEALEKVFYGDLLSEAFGESNEWEDAEKKEQLAKFGIYNEDF